MRLLGIILGLLLLPLSACNGPSPRLAGTPAQVVEVDGSTFNVFVSGNRAEAVRTNFKFPATVRSVFPSAIRAMEIASDCSVPPASVTGDPAHIKARLVCA